MLDGECQVVALGELGPSELKRWEQLRAHRPALRSAFLSAAYAAQVGAVRRDALVAVLRDGGPAGGIAGFLPFHTSPTRLGRPLGRKLSDAQGAVVHPDHAWDPRAVVRRAGLRSLSFDHLVDGQPALAPYVTASDESLHLDLSGGFEGYVAEARRQGRGAPRHAARMRRRLDRARGDVTFTWDDPDPAGVRALIAWKSQQYRRTRAFDQMRRPWVPELLERLHASADPTCAGVLSTLRVGGQLVAVEFCLRSGDHLASWFPAYDPTWATYSPGNVLFLDLVRAAAAAGVRTIGVGKGVEAYKHQWITGSTPVRSAVVPGHPLAMAVTTAGRIAWGIARRTPAHAAAGRLRWRIDVG